MAFSYSALKDLLAEHGRQQMVDDLEMSSSFLRIGFKPSDFVPTPRILDFTVSPVARPCIMCGGLTRCVRVHLTQRIHLTCANDVFGGQGGRARAQPNRHDRKRLGAPRPFTPPVPGY